MDSKLLARIGAVVFIAIAITMTAIEISRAPEPPRAGPAVPRQHQWHRFEVVI